MLLGALRKMVSERLVQLSQLSNRICGIPNIRKQWEEVQEEMVGLRMTDEILQSCVPQLSAGEITILGGFRLLYLGQKEGCSLVRAYYPNNLRRVFELKKGILDEEDLKVFISEVKDTSPSPKEPQLDGDDAIFEWGNYRLILPRELYYRLTSGGAVLVMLKEGKAVLRDSKDTWMEEHADQIGSIWPEYLPTDGELKDCRLALTRE